MRGPSIHRSELLPSLGRSPRPAARDGYLFEDVHAAFSHRSDPAAFVAHPVNRTRGDSVFNIALASDSSKCLDLPGGDTSAGTMLEIWDCNGLSNQQWVFAPDSWRIQPATNKGMCIDNLGGGGEGNKLGIWNCNGGDNQVWGYDTTQKTIYLAASQSDASLCMDLPGGDTSNGNSIQVWGCYGGSTQQWAIFGPGPSPPGPSPGGGCYDKSAISSDQLSCVYPRLGSNLASRYAPELNNWMGDSLNTACKWAAFLANVGTESAELTEWTQVPCSAATDAPYCGRGPLQLTSYNNYKFCAGQGVCSCPDIAQHPEEVSNDDNIGMGSASCVWKALAGRDMSNYADGSREGLKKTACYINAGHYPCTPNGWESRQQYWEAANKCLGI